MQIDYSLNIKEWGLAVPEHEYKVVIHCLTYNHERYIRQALDGFVMQRTNFPFCAIIIDDASNDHTVNIIKEYEQRYPEIIKSICLKYNHHQQGLSKDPYFSCWFKHTEYVAYCEGDDYWLDPCKLQKQVDFLDKNKEYNIVHTYFKFVNEDNSIVLNPSPMYRDIKSRIRDGYIWGYYLRYTGFILTCTICIRMPLDLEEKRFFDAGTYMTAARWGKAYCIREETAAYRRNSQGAILSSPSNYYNDLSKRAWLYQLYYYHKNGHNVYYDEDKETKQNRAYATLHAIELFLKGKMHTSDLKTFAVVLCKEFVNTLYYLPSILLGKSVLK